MSRRVMLSASTWFRFSTLLAHAEASSAMGSLAIVPKCCSSLAPHDKPLSPTRRRRRARLTHGPRSPAARQVDAMGRRLRSPRLPGVDVPGVDGEGPTSTSPAWARRLRPGPAGPMAERWLSLSWWWARPPFGRAYDLGEPPEYRR